MPQVTLFLFHCLKLFSSTSRVWQSLWNTTHSRCTLPPLSHFSLRKVCRVQKPFWTLSLPLILPSLVPPLSLCSGLNVICCVSISLSTWAVSREHEAGFTLSVLIHPRSVSGCLAASQPWPNTLQRPVKSLCLGSPRLSSPPRHRESLSPLSAQEESKGKD